MACVDSCTGKNGSVSHPSEACTKQVSELYIGTCEDVTECTESFLISNWHILLSFGLNSLLFQTVFLVLLGH